MTQPCNITVRRLTVQEDHTVDSDDGAELKWWKRTKATITAERDEHVGRFQAILDTRARVIRFRVEEPGVLSVDNLARAVAYEMASFATYPLPEVLQRRRQAPEGQSVWMARDAELVSGLLHQGKESGAFQPRERPPLSPALNTVIGDLIVCVDTNLHASYEWTQGNPSNPLLGLDFDTSAWDAHQHIVLRDLGASGARRNFVDFFEKTATYARILQQARQDLAREHGAIASVYTGAVTPVNVDRYEEQARAGVRQGSHQYQQTGLALLGRFEEDIGDEQRKELRTR